MNIDNSLISSFFFLDTLEAFVKNDLNNDPSLAIGKFEFNRILNFEQQYAIFHLWFTDDETHTSKHLASVNIQCTSHQENQYAFKGSINFLSTKKEHPFTIIVDTQEKIKSFSFKLSMYFKSFLVEALGDKVLKDVDITAPRQTKQPTIDEEADKLMEIERKKKERTIQMNPLDLQKELFEEAMSEEKTAESKSKIPAEDSHQPLEMSADEIEKMLLGDTAPAQAAPSPAEDSHQPLEMSADEIEKMLLSDAVPDEKQSPSQSPPPSNETQPATESATIPTQQSDEDFINQLQSQLVSK